MTTVFSQILLATEHSEFDSGAERTALALAKRQQLTLHGVLPVLSNSEYESVAPQLAAKSEREAAQKMAELRHAAAALGVTLDLCARRGEELYREILEQAREIQADLIITRRRGKRGFLANLLIGEMVSKVVMHAPCSVLMVPRSGQLWQQGVLAGIDESPSAKTIVDKALQVAHESSLPLTLVHVNTASTSPSRGQHPNAMARAIRSAQRLGVPLATHTIDGKPFEQLLNIATATGADLVVIGRRGEAGVKRALIGGTAQKVIGLANVPVMVVNC